MSLIKSNIAEEFDAFSKNYREDMITVVPHYEALLSAFLQAVPADRHIDSVLDVGCGNGIVTDLLLTRYADAHYTLLDASKEMLDICRKRFAQYQVDYVQSYFSDYAFPESSYDLVVAGFSLHHCHADEKQQLYQKIHQSLQSGGCLVMSDLFISKSDEDHPALLEEWKSHTLSHDATGEKWAWLSEHYDAFDSPDNLQDVSVWLQQAGFSKIDIVWQQGHWINLKATK